MRKIINGKAYDTETAHLVGENDNNDASDSNRIIEKLYRKKTGEYFLYGWGGAFTRYCEHISSREFSSGDRFTPLSVEQARKFAEQSLTATEYEAEFSVAEE